MSDHDDWLKYAETKVLEEFPSLSDVDAARIVAVAVDAYEKERWVKLAQRINTIWFNTRKENMERETWPDDR